MTDIRTLSYTAEHEWVALDGDIATVGITDYAADKLGDIVYVDLPAVGTSVTANAVCGEIESTKSVGELFAPLNGEVVEVNDDVVGDPSLVNSAPYEGGWLLRLRVSPDDVAGLLDRAGYEELTGGDA